MINELPPINTVLDKQFISIPVATGYKSYEVDQESKTFYSKETEIIIPSLHGTSHVSTDPVPDATPDIHGLMSSSDKAKLDTLLQMRLGVLGFQGSGFPDDGGFLCFPAGSKVLLPNSSSKSIESLNVGDEVITHTGKVQKIIKTFRRTYAGKLRQIWVSGHFKDKFAATPEHPVLAIKNVNNYNAMKIGFQKLDIGKPSWISVNELRVGDYIARRHASEKIIDRDVIYIEDITERVEICEGKAYSYESTNGTLAPAWRDTKGPEMHRNTAKPVNNEIVVGPEFLRLCGYYLSEGHIDGRPGAPKEVIFSVHTDEAFGALGADITHCCEFVFGIRPTIKPNPSGGYSHQLCLQNAIAARFIKQLLPGTAHTKLIPQWMMELPAEKQKWLLTAFLEGDGSINIRKSSKTIGCGLCNEQLINQLCALFERQDATPIVRSYRVFLPSTQKWYDGYHVDIQASDLPWLLNALGGPELRENKEKWPRRINLSIKSNGYTLRRIKAITDIEYNNDVFNIKVENDNSYIVNGLVAHNCGDVILASGSELLTIERIGNTIRFSVDNVTPLVCNTDACSQIYWVQDESASKSIRPPSCNGVMPNVNSYGEFKVYLLPENTVIDSTNPLATLNTKGNYPTFAFTRYNNAITPYQASLEAVLARNSDGTSNVGWAFTPGSTGIVSCVYFMGKNSNSQQMKFELWPNKTPGLLGSLLFNGNSITKQMAVIVNYTTDVLHTNQYTCKYWDVVNQKAIGDTRDECGISNATFTATNVWAYQNPGNSPNDPTNPQALVPDYTTGLLPVGTLVDLWEFEINRANGCRTLVRYFSKEPKLNAANIWALSGSVQFGDLLIARDEQNDPNAGSSIVVSKISVADVRLFEDTVWGLTNFEDPLFLSDDGESAQEGSEIVKEPSGIEINNSVVAKICTNVEDQYGVYRMGLEIIERPLPSQLQPSPHSVPEIVTDRPVFLWNRQGHMNSLTTMKIGQPDAESVAFPPYDLLLRAPIDKFGNLYLNILRRGMFTTGKFAGSYYIVANGVRWEDMPAEGTLRILTGSYRNYVWKYDYKAAFSPFNDNAITLIGDTILFPFDNDISGFSGSDYDRVPSDTTVVELLHQDFNAPAVRFQFTQAISNGKVALTMQAIVGTLDMNVKYPLDTSSSTLDDMVRGFSPGYTVSRIFSQSDVILDGVGANVVSSPSSFRLYRGGLIVGGTTEQWNDVTVMHRDAQVWIWWNGLIVSPDPVACASLPTPVAVNTPYFPITNMFNSGKVGLRLFPGAFVRQMDTRTQLKLFNEYAYGQLQISV